MPRYTQTGLLLLDAKRKRILIVCRQAPYGSSLARESLELALAAAVFEQDLALLFIGDGVLQLLGEQHSDGIGQKSQLKLASALPLYDVSEVYVDAQALRDRALELHELAIPATALSNSQLSEIMAAGDVILNF